MPSARDAESVLSHRFGDSNVLVHEDTHSKCGDWVSYIRGEGLIVNVKFQNELCDPTDPAKFFTLHDGSFVRARLIVTPDESVLGRCVAVHETPSGWAVFATVSDRSLDAERLADVVHVMFTTLASDETGVVGNGWGGRRESIVLRYRMAIAVGLPLTTPSAKVRPPDLAKLFRFAPGPVKLLSPDAVSFAGDRVVVTIDKTPQEAPEETAKDHDVSWTPRHQLVIRADLDAYHRSPLETHSMVWPTTDRVPGVYVVSQHSAASGKSRTVVRAKGVTPFHIASVAHAVLSAVGSQRSGATEVRVLDALLRFAHGPATLTREILDRERVADAVERIGRQVDRNLWNIKARLWHPTGALVNKRIVSETAQCTTTTSA